MLNRLFHSLQGGQGAEGAPTTPRHIPTNPFDLAQGPHDPSIDPNQDWHLGAGESHSPRHSACSYEVVDERDLLSSRSSMSVISYQDADEVPALYNDGEHGCHALPPRHSTRPAGRLAPPARPFQTSGADSLSGTGLSASLAPTRSATPDTLTADRILHDYLLPARHTHEEALPIPTLPPSPAVPSPPLESSPPGSSASRIILSWLRTPDPLPTPTTPASTENNTPLARSVPTPPATADLPQADPLAQPSLASAPTVPEGEDGWEMGGPTSPVVHSITRPVVIATVPPPAPTTALYTVAGALRRRLGLSRARSVPLLGAEVPEVVAAMDAAALEGDGIDEEGMNFTILKEQRDELVDKLLSTDAALAEEQMLRRQADAEAAAQRAIVQQLLAAQMSPLARSVDNLPSLASSDATPRAAGQADQENDLVFVNDNHNRGATLEHGDVDDDDDDIPQDDDLVMARVCGIDCLTTTLAGLLVQAVGAIAARCKDLRKKHIIIEACVVLVALVMMLVLGGLLGIWLGGAIESSGVAQLKGEALRSGVTSPALMLCPSDVHPGARCHRRHAWPYACVPCVPHTDPSGETPGLSSPCSQPVPATPLAAEVMPLSFPPLATTGCGAACPSLPALMGIGLPPPTQPPRAAKGSLSMPLPAHYGNSCWHTAPPPGSAGPWCSWVPRRSLLRDWWPQPLAAIPHPARPMHVPSTHPAGRRPAAIPLPPTAPCAGHCVSAVAAHHSCSTRNSTLSRTSPHNHTSCATGNVSHSFSSSSSHQPSSTGSSNNSTHSASDLAASSFQRRPGAIAAVVNSRRRVQARERVGLLRPIKSVGGHRRPAVHVPVGGGGAGNSKARDDDMVARLTMQHMMLKSRETLLEGQLGVVKSLLKDLEGAMHRAGMLGIDTTQQTTELSSRATPVPVLVLKEEAPMLITNTPATPVVDRSPPPSPVPAFIKTTLPATRVFTNITLRTPPATPAAVPTTIGSSTKAAGDQSVCNCSCSSKPFMNATAIPNCLPAYAMPLLPGPHGRSAMPCMAWHRNFAIINATRRHPFISARFHALAAPSPAHPITNLTCSPTHIHHARLMSTAASSSNKACHSHSLLIQRRMAMLLALPPRCAGPSYHQFLSMARTAKATSRLLASLPTPPETQPVTAAAAAVAVAILAPTAPLLPYPGFAVASAVAWSSRASTKRLAPTPRTSLTHPAVPTSSLINTTSNSNSVATVRSLAQSVGHQLTVAAARLVPRQLVSASQARLQAMLMRGVRARNLTYKCSTSWTISSYARATLNRLHQPDLAALTLNNNTMAATSRLGWSGDVLRDWGIARLTGIRATRRNLTRPNKPNAFFNTSRTEPAVAPGLPSLWANLALNSGRALMSSNMTLASTQLLQLPQAGPFGALFGPWWRKLTGCGGNTTRTAAAKRSHATLLPPSQSKPLHALLARNRTFRTQPHPCDTMALAGILGPSTWWSRGYWAGIWGPLVAGRHRNSNTTSLPAQVAVPAAQYALNTSAAIRVCAEKMPAISYQAALPALPPVALKALAPTASSTALAALATVAGTANRVASANRYYAPAGLAFWMLKATTCRGACQAPATTNTNTTRSGMSKAIRFLTAQRQAVIQAGLPPRNRTQQHPATPPSLTPAVFRRRTSAPPGPVPGRTNTSCAASAPPCIQPSWMLKLGLNSLSPKKSISSLPIPSLSMKAHIFRLVEGLYTGQTRFWDEERRLFKRCRMAKNRGLGVCTQVSPQFQKAPPAANRGMQLAVNLYGQAHDLWDQVKYAVQMAYQAGKRQDSLQTALNRLQVKLTKAMSHKAPICNLTCPVNTTSCTSTSTTISSPRQVTNCTCACACTCPIPSTSLWIKAVAGAHDLHTRLLQVKLAAATSARAWEYALDLVSRVQHSLTSVIGRIDYLQVSVCGPAVTAANGGKPHWECVLLRTVKDNLQGDLREQIAVIEKEMQAALQEADSWEQGAEDLLPWITQIRFSRK